MLFGEDVQSTEARDDDHHNLALYFSCDEQLAAAPSYENGSTKYTTVFTGQSGGGGGGERGSDWTQFLRIVDFLSAMSDSTAAGKCRSTPTDVPSLGDLIFSVAQLLVLPNALEGCPSSCSSSGSARPGGVGLDNHIVRDLFVLSVRRFTELYLQELVQSCDAAQRAKIFQVKTWLTCRLHFDHQLVDSLSQAVQLDRGVRSVTQSEARQLVEKSISNATNGRLVFRDSPNRGAATLARVESFSPTFALFTLCNMRDEYAATSHTQRQRFDRDDAEANVGRAPSVQDCLALYGASPPSTSAAALAGTVSYKSRGGGGVTAAGAIFRPSGRTLKQQLVVTTNANITGGGGVGGGVANSLWPEQKLLVNARGLVNRDRTLQRFVNVACVEKSAAANHQASSLDSAAQPSTPSSTTRHHHSSTALSAGAAAAAAAAARTITPGVSDAIKMFDRCDHYESRFRADRNVAPLARGFDAYRQLLQRLTLAWGKLNFLEPNIFT